MKRRTTEAVPKQGRDTGEPGEAREKPIIEIFGRTLAEVLCAGKTNMERVTLASELSIFFGITKTRALANGRYTLPDEFDDWEEWHTVVLSALKARLAIKMREVAIHSGEAGMLAGIEERTLKLWGMTGGFRGGIDKNKWLKLFGVLQKSGKVKPSDAVAFLRRVTEREKNYREGKAHPFPPRQSTIIRHWIQFLPYDSKGLCTMDNRSAAHRLAELEKGNTSDPMTPANFSREKGRLGLVSCRKPSWKIQVDHGREYLVKR